MMDQYDAWRKALRGEKIDFQKGSPPSGFWRQGTTRGIEAIAIWRDDDGQIHYKRNLFFDHPQFTTGAEIGELLSASFRYPISYELYLDVTKNGSQWPPEHSTRLTLKEIEAGTAWTLELARKKIAKATKGTQHENL